MSRYQYDIFILFNSDAKKHVEKFLNTYQSQAQWKVHKSEANDKYNVDNITQAMHKSRVVLEIQSSCELSIGFLMHKAIGQALAKYTMYCSADNLKKDSVMQSLFTKLQSMLDEIRSIEDNKILSEKMDRKSKIGFMDIDFQSMLNEKSKVFQEHKVMATMFEQSGIGLTKYKLKNGEYYGMSNLEDKRNGYGDMRYFNNDHYSGDWIDDLRHGFGMYRYNNGMVYHGEWFENKKEGLGSIHSNCTYLFKGYMKKGCKNGKGVYFYKGGSLYGGNWLNDQRNGQGIYWDGEKQELYDGEWCMNKKHGKGAFFASDDEKYDGFWRDDLKNGCGCYWYENGDRFVGEWVNGKKHGHGVLYDAGGDVFDCEYENDKLVKKVNRSTCEDVSNETKTSELNGKPPKKPKRQNFTFKPILMTFKGGKFCFEEMLM